MIDRFDWLDWEGIAGCPRSTVTGCEKDIVWAMPISGVPAAITAVRINIPRFWPLASTGYDWQLPAWLLHPATDRLYAQYNRTLLLIGHRQEHLIPIALIADEKP